MKLTAANSKTKPEEDLLGEFWRLFEKEQPEATAWAWESWRGKSSYWPSIFEIGTLYKDWHRGQREQAELKARQEEKRLLDEGRKRGELVGFPTVLEQLKSAALEKLQTGKRLRDERLAADNMRPVASALETLHLTEEQIQARRENLRAAEKKAREHMRAANERERRELEDGNAS